MTTPRTPLPLSAPPRPDEEIAAAERWLQPCGSCDAGLAVDCTCPRGDFRIVIDALLARVVAAEKKLAAVDALAEEWRYKGEFGWGPWQLGEGPDQEGWVLDQAASEIRAALADEVTQ